MAGPSLEPDPSALAARLVLSIRKLVLPVYLIQTEKGRLAARKEESSQLQGDCVFIWPVCPS